MRAIDADAIVVHKFLSEDYDPSENDAEKAYRKGWNDALDAVAEFQPSVEPEQKIFEEMSDTEFEKWLYEHGICNPDIHESISCSIVPLLIDNAINELSAEPSSKRESKRGWYQKGYRDGKKAQQDMKRSFAEYIPFITTWLMDYQVRAAELKGRYTAYEVLGWVVNDWMKENPERPDEP